MHDDGPSRARVRTRYALTARERLMAGVLADALRPSRYKATLGVRIDFRDKTTLTLPLHGAIGRIFLDVVRAAARGNVALVEAEQTVSPAQAAAMLGVSRSWVRDAMAAGRLRYRLVGTHRRLASADVLRQGRGWNAARRVEAGTDAEN